MDCPETSWKQLTLSGNELFERSLYRQAMQAYENARCVALQHFQAWGTPSDAVAAMVVSYLNLSEAQARSGRIDQASVSLRALHTGLLQAQADQSLNCCVRSAAQSHIRESYAALQRFQDLHGECPEIQHWLNEGCTCQPISKADTCSQRTLH